MQSWRLAILHSCFLAFLRSCFLAFLHSCFLAFLASCYLAILLSCFLAFLHSCYLAFLLSCFLGLWSLTSPSANCLSSGTRSIGAQLARLNIQDSSNNAAIAASIFAGGVTGA